MVRCAVKEAIKSGGLFKKIKCRVREKPDGAGSRRLMSHDCRNVDFESGMSQSQIEEM